MHALGAVIQSKGKTMANEMPKSQTYKGLSAKVLQYSESFLSIVNRIKQPGFSDADWAPLEALVDLKNFRRQGVFLGAVAETSDWRHYKELLSKYGGHSEWEGTLRRITEVPGLVYLELEERNSRNGVMDVANTVTIYEFNSAEKLIKLDVYVMPLGKR
jgi:hypothetical protein